MSESLRRPRRILTGSRPTIARGSFSRLRSATAALAIVISVGASALVPAPPAPTHCLMAEQGGSRTCFSTYREAINYATDGAIDDAPLTARAAATDPTFRSRLEAYNATAGARTGAAEAPTRLAGDRVALIAHYDAPCPDKDMSGKKFSTGNCIIAATLFDGTGFSGNSVTLWIPHPCNPKNGLQDYGWRITDPDKLPIKSMTVWSNCKAWLWNKDFSAKDGPFKNGNYTTLGDWNGKVEVFTLS